MSLQAVQTTKTGAVLRPLKVLVPLIKEALEHAKEAAQEAATPYWLEAGTMMFEAKSQMDHGEFRPWLRRKFGIGDTQATRYMKLVKVSDQNDRRAVPTTLSEALRAAGHEPRGPRVPLWTEPVRETVSKINFERMRQDEQGRVDERKLERELALKLIDIGYRVLATKLHPDKGGSRDAMARLNHVRERLKNCA